MLVSLQEGFGCMEAWNKMDICLVVLRTNNQTSPFSSWYFGFSNTSVLSSLQSLYGCILERGATVNPTTNATL
jgi:hypothetical protein